MGKSLPSLIFYSVQQHNILPVTSRCNLSCMFCSNRQNPPGTDVYSLPHRNLREIRESFQYLSPGKKIIIGESATRIMEGEPFYHPRIGEILRDLRKEFPETPLQVTTNGTVLGKDVTGLLQRAAPLELVISTNTLDADARRKFLGDKHPREIQENIKRIAGAGVNFHGSVVALPRLWGWEDLKETLKYLDENGAGSLRLFLPGYTRLAPPRLAFDPTLWEELRLFVKKFSGSLKAPLLFDPPHLSGLEARVEGVINNSPAQKAGLQKGDTILEIDGQEAWSRTHAFDLAREAGDPFLEISRRGRKEQVRLIKGEGESPGFVLYMDMDPLRAEKFLGLLDRYKDREVLVLTSRLGLPLVKDLVEKAFPGRKNVSVIAVKNNFFGGSIMSSGLLVAQDFIDTLVRLKKTYHLAVIPGEPFDFQGKDLTGKSFLEIQEETGLPVVTA